MTKDGATDRTQPIRFAVIGLLSTALYFLLLVGLRDLVPSTFVLAGICYAISMAFNFVAQGLFTFRTGRLTGRKLGRYLIVQLAAMAANSTAMAGLVDLLTLPLIPSQVVVTGTLAVIVYFASKAWVYSD